ncbi:hypothetical protein NQZ68_014936 [Dissostichus eleginoides]|nr:hypothetical protein NQZ68_014936 [Dissostichus eleginoides]
MSLFIYLFSLQESLTETEREGVRDLVSLGDSLQRTAMTGGISNTSNTNWKK